MLQQEAMIERTRRVCREDERLAAAMMYGSFARGEGDGFSNIEFILFFRVVNWFVFGSNLFAWGEFARSLDLLGIVRDRLFRRVRPLEGSTLHWFNSAKFLETEISQSSYARYAVCAARLDRDGLRQACLSAWELGRALMASLGERHGVIPPVALLFRLDRRFAETFGAPGPEGS